MKETGLHRLARKYAAELYPEEAGLIKENEESPNYNSLAVDVIEECEAQFFSVARWLLRGHCLVDKATLQNLYESYKDLPGYAPRETLLMQRIFGTEIFEERSGK